MTYAQDLPEVWSGCDFIVGASAGVPIKKGAMEVISSGTPVGISIEKQLSRKVERG